MALKMKNWPAAPLECAVTKKRARKSFAFRTYIFKGLKLPWNQHLQNRIIYLTQVCVSGSLFLHARKPQSRLGLSESANDLRMSRFTSATSFRRGTFSSGLLVLRFFLRGAFMALLEMLHKYSTDEKCREILTKLRWPEGVRCPRCKEDRVCYLEDRKQFECASCTYQFSVTTGTIFNDTHLPLEKWLAATMLLCEAKKGMSACQIQRTLGMSYKTAWYLCHRIRHAMAQTDKPMLDGTVEMDETYVGGVNKGKGRVARVDNKEVVVGIRKRNGDLRFFHAKDAKSGTLARYIRERISEDVEVIITDDFSSHPVAMEKAGKKNFKTIQHSKGNYVVGDVHTNTVESAFSLLKRGIMGTWHKISAKHLPAYLEEMEFRFNRRKRPDLFLDTLRHMVTAPVLTFQELTA
jgi:transposase-like protein